jgi:TetR/AcrR family transcriptional regulator, cholesterol catabolism regulator
MDEKFIKILETARDYSFSHKVGKLSIDHLCEAIGLDKKLVRKYVKSTKELVTSILDYERQSFKVIFTENDFEGVNAIDIMFTVSRELSQRFKDINPTLTYQLKKYYPKVYKEHLEDKYDFIFNKIKINIEKGINQGMYRDDLSVELVARLYMARLMDIHNPDFFPYEKFSFEMLFEYTIDSYVCSIATHEGLLYFEQKRKSFKPQK